MRYRTLIIVVVVLSLLLIAVPVAAKTPSGNMNADSLASIERQLTVRGAASEILNTLPEGSHDAFDGAQSPFFCRAEGWTADPDDRAVDLNVRIFSDGLEVAQTVAGMFRQDLADAGVCQDGTCSFSVNLASLISPGQVHTILVQAQDAQTGEWVNLYSTPKTLNCFEPDAQTLIVNSTADDADANLSDGVCETWTPGECTLRAAIMESNASPGTATISFNIPGDGPHTISPSYGFDFIFDPVVIDGTTQSGFSGTPIIELDGSQAGPDAYGIVIFAGSSTVRGLAINRFALTGIDLDVNGGNIIQGNYIGTDLTGSVDLGNGLNGVAISQGSSSNLIGGSAAGEGNLISGNGDFGIIIVDPGSNENVMQGNLIGTDATGTVDLGNGSVGVVIGAGASNNVIGGTQPGARNLISGNDSAGVHIDTVGTTGNVVQGNYIGTDVTGTVAIGNVYEGVFIGGGSSKNVIGGTSPGAGNVISGNNGYGVTITDMWTSGNVVQGNYIGTDVTGTLPLGNSDNGVIIATDAMYNLIGGTESGAGNVIAFNNVNGVVLTDDAGTGNAIVSNSIHSNVELGIDLGWDGVTSYDLFDLDSGPNNLQNSPILTMVKNTGRGTLVQGVLFSSADTAFRLEFFNSQSCDPSGLGEGQEYLGSVEVSTNAIGRATFKITLPASSAVESFVTATVTDPANNTSEFSNCIMVGP